MTLTPTRPSALWADVPLPPAGPRTHVSAAIARALFVGAVDRLPVTVRLHEAAGVRTLGRGGPEMDVRRPEELFARLGRDANVGFGEAYLTGAWDAEDLAGFLAVLAARLEHLVPKRLQAARALVMPRIGRHDHGREEDTQRNIAHHYDLSNELFATFLDPTMTYSSAWFDEGDDLERAQLRKIDALLDLAGVGAGTRVLEIGTGWGALAIRAAGRGATVRTITLSEEQAELARERIAEAGLTHLVDVDLCDYRAVEGEYDAVLSVEMIEAVGWRYWPTYFSTIDRVLAPGGRVAIQAITMADHRMRVTRDNQTWITKYIFPGGFLPSVEALDRATREATTLRLAGSTAFGQHYAETLRQWDRAFTARADQVEALGFDAGFRRMWHYYLEYCRAGFAASYIDVHQLLFTRETA
ncbi:class I SAM-dependent methyltransferase [Nocardioides ultimimeridianus]